MWVISDGRRPVPAWSGAREEEEVLKFCHVRGKGSWWEVKIFTEI